MYLLRSSGTSKYQQKNQAMVKSLFSYLSYTLLIPINPFACFMWLVQVSVDSIELCSWAFLVSWVTWH